MVRCAIAATTCLILLACGGQGGRLHTDAVWDSTIGKLPTEMFPDMVGISCGANFSDGCKYVATSGCAVRFNLDRSTGRVSSWEYISRPEVCWRLRGA